jgi:hypothetical protein
MASFSLVCLACLASATRAAAQDDHAAATSLVTELAKDTAHAAVTAEALAQAKQALERATRLRAAGDETHARAADGLAREWAETARDLVKTVDAEARAAELRRKAVDAQAQLERSRTLVEEEIARVGRLRAELAEVEKSGSKEERTAVEVHDGEAAPDKKKAGKKGAATAPPAPKKPGKTVGGAP